MEFNSTENKKMDTTSKILIAIIACILVIIVIICVMLFYIKQSTFKVNIDKESYTDIKEEDIFCYLGNKLYINIKTIANFVEYEYHTNEEYKSFTKEENKCYVKGTYETTSFYLNDNNIYKLELDNLNSEYNKFEVEYPTINKDGIIYASKDAIQTAFNVVIEIKEKSFSIYTLDHLIECIDKSVTGDWGYTSIQNLNFENKKALLYGYLIVAKKDGLYKIINNTNTAEIVSDKYIDIQFNESTKEFAVTNSLEQVGVINLDGTVKIEPIYNSITLLDKENDLYLIEKDEKYGVIKSGNITVLKPEFDSIGINFNNTGIQYFIDDTLIPVSKDGKVGAYDKNGKLVLDLVYDDWGCNVKTVEIDGVKKNVIPLLFIERCKGIVVRQGNKYGLMDVTGKELVRVAVDSMYELEEETKDKQKYGMIYNGKELKIIERLIIAGLLEETQEEEQEKYNITINS